MDINTIKGMCRKGNLRWTNHILIRLLQRSISMDDISCAVTNGEIIEQYADDYPHPSCLILGPTMENNYLHVVCGISEDELWLITAYYPNHDEWSNDFKDRKENRQ